MAEEPSKKPKRPAERIGKYEILERIAVGGMGIVFKARDLDLDRVVALKILDTELAKQDTTRIRFDREAKAAARLRHDNIVAIYDVGEYEGAYFIAMEYVDGTDLQEYITRNCRIDPNEARLLMIQAARALVHAHEQGIVHRDIKPSNFLLMFKDKQIVLKLADFGLAIRSESDDEFRLTKDKTTVGTVDYMSPEQARDSRSADIRSDIYSLGCTFYHMLGGAAPFATGTLPERIVQHMRSPAPDLRKLNQSVPEALVLIIQRMLAKKPDNRYQTPTELLHDLENLDKVAPPRKGAKSTKPRRFVSRMSRPDVTAVIENQALDEASAEPEQVKANSGKKAPPIRLEGPSSVADESSDEEEDAPAPLPRVKKKTPAIRIDESPRDDDELSDEEEPAQVPLPRGKKKTPAIRLERPSADDDEPADEEEPAQVPLPRVKKKTPAIRLDERPSADDDESTDEEPPAQVRSTGVKKKAPAARLNERPSVDDEASEEPEPDEVETETDSVDQEADPAMARTKNPVAASSPIWMYAVGGTVALLALILVIAFTTGSRPPLPKKEPDRKVEAPPPPPPVVVDPDKKVEPPEPVVPVTPPSVASIDTSPEKMTVVAPIFPRMDYDPAKADLPALRKEFHGPFETFPVVPEKANLTQVRRFNVAGSPSTSNLADAIAQTKADQFNVIEIPDNGPIFVSALPSVAKRTILLRGAAGHRPLLVWDPPKKAADPKAGATFLQVSSGRLILENVDIVMHAAAKSPAVIFDLPESDFFARDCTFSVGGSSPQGVPLIRRINPKPVGVAPTKTQTWLQRCYLRGPDALLLQHLESPADVLIEDSLVVGYQQPLLSLRAKDEDFLGLYCVRSTLVAGQVLARWQAADGRRVNPYFQARILDSILSRDDPTAPQGDMLQLKDAGDSNRMQWRASNSVYAGWKQLLASKTVNLVGHDLDPWHRHWSYSLSDRAIGEAWPSSPPSGLDELAAAAFSPAHTPLAFSALTSPGASGCVIGRLPPAPENWHERTLEPRQTPIFANIEVEAPRIAPATDGMYHGERLDLNKIDLGVYLTATLQKIPPAPRVVMHLTGKGVCSTSPLRVKGLQNLVLYFEPTKDPLILEVNPTSFKQRGPLIEMTGGHLEVTGARIRLSQVTIIPTMIHVEGGDLTLSRCWLTGPLTKTAASFQSLITVTNPNPTPAILLMRENVLVSSKLLIHAKDNVQVKARNNVLVSLGDGILYEASTPVKSLPQVFDHNTWAIRQAFVQLRAAPESAPREPMLMLVSNNAFLRPFDSDADRAALTRGIESWSAAGRWIWHGRYNVYDARLPAYHVPGPTKIVSVKQTLKDWQRTWGQTGEYEAQLLDTGLATRELSLEGATSPIAFGQLDRLQLSRQLRFDAAQGVPGADLFLLGILKKKGS